MTAKTHAFTLYNASAGSGKTYTLTKEYLKILLKSKTDDAYKRILAITFTNKAVEEMKTRIVKSLFEFSKDNTSEKVMDLLKDLSVETGFSMAFIKEKSKRIITSIIHNYTAFGISTIDKFTHRVIRSFAQDLDLPSNFEVSLDTDLLLQEAVDLVISKVGEDKELTAFLVDFSKSKADADRNWDVSAELLETAKMLVNDNYASELKAIEAKKLSDFTAIKNVLQAKIEELKKTCVAEATETLAFIEANINSDALYSKYVPNFLKKTISGNIAINTTVLNYLNGEKGRYSKAVSQTEKNWIDENASMLLEDLMFINQNARKIALYEAFMENINPLSLLNVIKEEFKKIQEDRNLLSISDFNKIIFNEIQNQPAPFIYERLGEKYRHFFIDEFQDTSEMQWQNLIPLIDNALSSEDNGIRGSLMLVGDPKQSIYRWRGGKAEQFIELSKEDNPKNPKQNPFSNKEKESKKVTNLDTNYRSFSEIIEFNNHFFGYMASHFENADYAELYQNSSQKTNTKQGGYVNISFIDAGDYEGESGETETDYSEKNLAYLTKTLETIKKVQKNGFRLGEIALLTRKKNEGVMLANFLTEQSIKILSSETLLIQNATEVKLIIALLRYLNNNNDNEAKSYFLYYIGKQINTEKVHDFIIRTLRLPETELETELQKTGITISFAACRTKSLYEAVETLVQTFIKEKANTSYIQYFMDLVLEKDARTQSGIADFLDYWDKTGYTKSIPSPESADAVRILTIHKAKGLEFPVVIYPFAEENFSSKKNDKLWIDFEESEAVDFPFALVNQKREVINYGEKASRIYSEKNQEITLDNINVLYVALTRAGEQLYIISNNGYNRTKENTINNLAVYFKEFLQIENKYNETCLEYEFGNPERLSEKPEAVLEQQSITLINEKLPSENIKIAQKEALMWETTQKDAITFGNILHEILAWINTPNEVEQAVNQAVENGLITHNQTEKTTEILLDIVHNKQLSDFFDGTGTFFTEHKIIDPEIGILIPDRFVLHGNNVCLLDYKTGQRKEWHNQQIEQYAQALQKMKYNVTKKALVYIGVTIEVVFL